jgi:hypothetical protein
MNRYYFIQSLLLMASMVPLQAATWYVATTGNDVNSCSSSSLPCKTINGAYQKAIGGDTIQLAAGTYADQSVNAKSPASTIIVQPASGTSVTLGGLTINGATRLEIRDLTTNDFRVEMNSNYITLRNVAVKGWLGYLGGSNISMIGGSVGPGVDFHPQIAPVNGWQGQGANFVFDGVWFHDWTRSNTSVHTECLQVAGTTNMIIRNSKFTNCAVFDLSFTSYNNAGRVTNLLMENNFFDTAVSGGYFSVHFSAMDGGLVRFNSAKQAMFVDTTYSNTGTLSIVGNNVAGGILDGNSGGCLGASMAAAYSYNVTQGVKCGATDVNTASGFVNASTMDLHLASGSVAIDFVPLSANGPTTDIDGNARPQGAARDAGAHEFTSRTSSVPPSPPSGLQAIVR